MRYRSRVPIMLAAAISILLVASPACAADRSVAFGLPGLPMLGLEYERGLSDSCSCCFTIGSLVFIDFSIGLGIRWYNDNSLMNGKYYGLYVHYTEGSFFGHYHFYSIQGILGHKKVYDSGLTFDVGVGPVYSIDNNGDANLGAWVVLMLGWPLP